MKSKSMIVSLAALLIANAALQTFPYTKVSASASEIFINEVCTQNKSGLTDSYGSHSDWIEIYNSGNSPVDISGYGLSDKPELPLNWTFPANTTINAGERLIVFASSQESIGNEIHTNFSLSKNGETLVLSSPDGSILQQVEIPVLGEDVTYGRTPDGSDTLEIMSPTPGTANAFVVSAPEFSAVSGFYGTDFSLSMTAPAGTTIVYTTDGSNPITSNTAQTYNSPITVKQRSGEPNIYSEYEENEMSATSISRGTSYRKPSFNVDKATVVRAAAKNSDGTYSSVTDQVYFITSGNTTNTAYQNLTVISLVTDPENLFDPDKGIYVTGNQYLQWRNSGAFNANKSVWDIDNICNYFSKGKDWERPATVSIFEKGNLLLEQEMGIRIKGASTRNTAQKSFNIYARSEYGASKINIPLLEDNYALDNGKLIKKYDSLSIRSVGEETRLRDGFAQRLLYGRNLTLQNMRPCVVFLNGEYWGLYEITEKLSDFFIESNYGIQKENVAMIKSGELEEGSQDEFDRFNNFVKEYSGKDLKDETNYKAVCDFIDVDTMIEHYAAALYLGTFDWPNYNYGLWRNTGEAIEGNPYSDGKWRFMSYDFDYTMGATYENFGGVEGYAYDSFKHMTKRQDYAPTSLFVKLLENPDFRAKFVGVYCDYANEVLTSEKANAMADYYKQNYAEMLANTQLRWWGFYGSGSPSGLISYYKSEYENKILSGIKTFFQQRASYTLEDMKEYLHLNGSLQTITLQTNGGGKVQVSSVIADTSSGRWTGKYFSDSPVTITAIPDEGQEFTGWSGDASGSDKTITITLNQALNITASFGEATFTPVVKYDVNADSKFDCSDALMLQNYLLGITELTDSSAADINEDGKINILDLCMIKEALIG